MGEQMEVDDSGPVGNRPLPGSCIMGGLSIRNLVVYTIESMAIGLGHRLPPKNRVSVVGFGPGNRTRRFTSFESLAPHHVIATQQSFAFRGRLVERVARKESRSLFFLIEKEEE